MQTLSEKEAPVRAVRGFRYLDALATAFVVVLLVSNLLAQKVCQIGPLAVSGAILLFPITYIFGNIFTEVYGFAASRRAIWMGFFGTALLYCMAALTISLPAAPGWPNQQAFSTVFPSSRVFLQRPSWRSGVASSRTPT